MIPKDITVCIIDYGNFSYIAERFAKTFNRVLLYCPYEEGFPKYNKYVMGSGMKGVEKVKSIWPYWNEIDFFVFTDLYQGEFQDWLRNQGRAVFGSGRGEDMELLRDYMKSLQRESGMELNNYDVLYGLDSLQKYLETNEDRYIKTNVLRGGMETWHHQNIKLSQPLLDELNHTLGVFKNNQTFIAETPINDAVEYGYDGFVLDGEYPEKVMFGIEKKDAGYVSVFCDYNDLPKPVKDINKKLSPHFERYGYRGWYSSEIRSFTKDKGILLDSTCRCGEPPTSLAVEMLSDYPLYAWQIAIGEMPNIRAKYKYGAQIIIKSDWARSDAQAIYFPEQYRDYVKIKNLVIQDGIYYYVPVPAQEMCEIGAVLGMADTLKGAIEQAKMIAGEIKGYGLEINGDALDDIEIEIQKLKKIGVNIF